MCWCNNGILYPSDLNPSTLFYISNRSISQAPDLRVSRHIKNDSVCVCGQVRHVVAAKLIVY